jgi:hypothetical protein
VCLIYAEPNWLEYRNLSAIEVEALPHMERNRPKCSLFEKPHAFAEPTYSVIELKRAVLESPLRQILYVWASE